MIYEKMGFRFYTPFQIQPSGRNLFYVEVWPEKSSSQESLQGQKRIPLWFLWQQAEWVGGGLGMGGGTAPELLGSRSRQSRTLAALGAYLSPKL